MKPSGIAKRETVGNTAGAASLLIGNWRAGNKAF